RIADVWGVGGVAGRGASGHGRTVAVLRYRARPVLAARAETSEQLLQVGGRAVRVAATGPLAAVEHQVHLRRAARDPDPVDAAAEGEAGMTPQTGAPRAVPPIPSFKVKLGLARRPRPVAIFVSVGWREGIVGEPQIVGG